MFAQLFAHPTTYPARRRLQFCPTDRSISPRENSFRRAVPWHPIPPRSRAPKSPPPPRQSISPDIALLRIAVILRSPARSCYRVSRRVSRRIGRLVADPHSGRRCTLLYNKPNSIAGDTASSEAFPRSSTAAVQRPIKIA